MNEQRALFRPLLLLIGILLIQGGCKNFQKLEDDLKTLVSERSKSTGMLEDETGSGQSLMVLYLGDVQGRVVLFSIPMEQPGDFEFWSSKDQGWLFAFSDINGDNRFQLGESYGWANDANPLDTENLNAEQLRITIQEPGSGQAPAPMMLAGQPVLDIARLRFSQIGELADPLDSRFSKENATKGMWQPYAALKEGNSGIFFVEPYDPERTPVLFVHGMTGFPGQLSPLMDSLDRERFQVWFMNFPSGFYLSTLGEGLYRALEKVRRKIGFTRLHLVAHSMGGLVSQHYVQRCVKEDACEYLEAFISVASPFNGMDSAAYGAEHAPEVVPAWTDLAPGSDFLNALFAQTLPGSTEHFLMFAYRNDRSLGDIISVESTDGVVPLRSQLRREAQNQAARIAGFDQTHVGILSDPALLETVNRILAEQESRH